MKTPEEILEVLGKETKLSIVNLIRTVQSDSIMEGFRSGCKYLTDITHRNYEATKRRGLITSETTEFDFVVKLEEEVEELHSSCNEIIIGRDFDPSELADITLVCFAMAEHYGIDLIEEMRKKTEFNETRR